MLLAKVEDGQIAEYPYGISQLKRDNPNVIFTLPLNPETLADYGVVEVLPAERPEYDPITHDLTEAEPIETEDGWLQQFQLTEASPEQQTERYNSRANWQQFYNGLLINAAFVRARAGAAEVLAINAAYTDAVGALGLAVQGIVNVPAIQACFDNLLAVMTGDFALTKEQRDELQALLEACYLDRLITFNWNAPIVG